MKSSTSKILVFFFLIASIFSNAQETLITKNELPQEAQKFISGFFSKHAVDFVKKDKETFSTEYKIRFTDGKEIEFDSKGNWIEVDGKGNAFSTSFIQKNILMYVKQKFPNTQIVKIERSQFGKQEVKLSNGLELEFNSKGEFKRIDD